MWEKPFRHKDPPTDGCLQQDMLLPARVHYQSASCPSACQHTAHTHIESSCIISMPSAWVSGARGPGCCAKSRKITDREASGIQSHVTITGVWRQGLQPCTTVSLSSLHSYRTILKLLIHYRVHRINLDRDKPQLGFLQSTLKDQAIHLNSTVPYTGSIM